MLREQIECVAHDAVATLYAGLFEHLDQDFCNFLTYGLLHTVKRGR